MTENDLQGHIRNANLLPVYFLHGEEDFLIERIIAVLREAALGDGDASFNVDVYYGSEHKAEDITAAANAFPVMAKRRVVIVKEAEKLFSSTALASYISGPAPETVLILVAENAGNSRKRTPAKQKKAIDVQSALAQAEKRGDAGILEFKALKDSAALRWISDEFRASGKHIAAEACTIFHALKGNSARELSSEVEKIISALSDRDEVTADDVYYHLGASKQYNLFELANAMLSRDTSRSLEIGIRLLDNESLVGILALLTRQYISLWRVRAMQFHGRCTDEQARSAGLVWGWQVENLRSVLPKYRDPLYFERCFECLLMADISVKTQVSNDAAVLTRLIYQLTASTSEQ